MHGVESKMPDPPVGPWKRHTTQWATWKCGAQVMGVVDIPAVDRLVHHDGYSDWAKSKYYDVITGFRPTRVNT